MSAQDRSSGHGGAEGPRRRAKGPAVIRTRPPGAGAPDAARGYDRTAGVIHDLANLLDGSMRQVNLALRSLDEAAGHRAESGELDRRLRVIRTALEQMSGLLTAATRPGGQGQMPRRLAGMSLADAVRHAASILEPEASDNGVRFDVRVDGRLESLGASSAYTVVLNAARNALDAMKSSGRAGVISIEAGVSGGPGEARVVIEVCDEGQGVRDREAAMRAFEPGYSTKRGRLGLGLALCRDIVSGLGGEVTLRQRNDGLGAVFRAQWPVGREPGTGEVGR